MTIESILANTYKLYNFETGQIDLFPIKDFVMTVEEAKKHIPNTRVMHMTFDDLHHQGMKIIDIVVSLSLIHMALTIPEK